MTGPEHYAEAERIQNALKAMEAEIQAQILADPRLPSIAVLQQGIANSLASAQVHATLALAAFVNAPSGGGDRIGGF